jgi:adenine/guanine phosphoribosyltransferase-like PRPP-binding protein
LVKVRLFLVFLSPSSPNHVTHANSERYVPLGYSRKFWYSDNLSAEVSSITSPSGQKRLYLDPNQVSLVKGKKAVIIDDAVSSGTTLKSTWDFLESVGCEILVCGVVMKQGERWKGVLGPERTGKVVWVFESPLLRKAEGGWVVRD